MSDGLMSFMKSVLFGKTTMVVKPSEISDKTPEPKQVTGTIANVHYRPRNRIYEKYLDPRVIDTIRVSQR